MADRAIRIGNLAPGYRAVATADANGAVAVTFPAGLFTKPPVVVATGVSSDGRDVVVTLTGDPTIAGCTLLARKSRTLPAVIASLAALAGFDLLQPVAAKVHVHALPAS